MGEPAGGEQVSGGGIVDVGDVHRVRAVADLPEATGFRPRDDSWNQVTVARPPDEMGPQSDRREVRAVPGEHLALGYGLGPRIVRGVTPGVGQRFVVAFDVPPGADDARRTREHEPADAVLSARGQDVA